jgi:hypothetical protein
LARELARQYSKPLLVVSLEEADAAARAKAWLEGFVTAHGADRSFRLGIGGPRESEAPGIYHRAVEFLRVALRGGLN